MKKGRTMMGVYEWQVVTGDGSCYKQASKPGMPLQDWVDQGTAKGVIFQAEGLPTVRFDVSRDTRVIFNRRNDPDIEYRDCDQTLRMQQGCEIKKQPRRHCQVIGYERNGRVVLILIDLKTGLIELIDGVTG